jgi:hypothetical protein
MVTLKVKADKISSISLNIRQGIDTEFIFQAQERAEIHLDVPKK